MRIGYLIPEFPSQTHAFFWREAAAIAAQGDSVRFLSTRRPPPGASAHPWTAEAVARTAYLFPPRPGPTLGLIARRPAAAARALRHIAALHESPPRDRALAFAFLLAGADLAARAAAEGLEHIHVHSFANAAHVAAIARILGGPPYSLTLHGDLPVYGRDHAAKARGAAFLTTVTRPLAEALRAAIPGADPAVIAMGVDTARFTPAARPPPAPPLRLLTVARLAHVKGHAHALAAMAALVGRGFDLHYRIVGEGPERPAIAARIAALGLGGRVTLTGSLGEDAVLSELRAAHVLLLTSFGQGEAAPVAVMEAMSCGLPVICSRIGGTADMIEDGRDGLLVPQRDESAIAAALEALWRDPDLRARLGAAARARAVAQFDSAARAAELRALIHRAGGRG
jgi:glycosyltransferase involved in cell wall biosynthesis